MSLKILVSLCQHDNGMVHMIKYVVRSVFYTYQCVHAWMCAGLCIHVCLCMCFNAMNMSTDICIMFLVSYCVCILVCVLYMFEHVTRVTWLSLFLSVIFPRRLLSLLHSFRDWSTHMSMMKFIKQILLIIDPPQHHRMSYSHVPHCLLDCLSHCALPCQITKRHQIKMLIRKLTSQLTKTL